MENLPLHLKHRPNDFTEFIGNDSVVESLTQILHRKNRIVKAFLIYGPSGCGKTTLARIIKKELDCSEKDFYEYNMANTRGIDTIRDIIGNSIYSPIQGTVKIYLIDECHKLTGDAQNSLLKILEDTPEHIRFILCTTDPDKLITTIRNRSTTYQVSPLITPKMTALLRDICKKENLDIRPTIIREIVKAANGSPRHALVLLEQIADIKDPEVALKIIGEGLADEAKTIELCRALLKKDWSTVADLLKNMNVEPENVRRAIMNYLGTVLLNTSNPDVANKMLYFSENFFDSGKSQLVLSCFLACKN